MSQSAEPARTRKHGTQVFRAATYDEFITAARHVTQNGYSKVNGKMLDLTTASAVIAVHDALNEKNLDAVRRMYSRIMDQAKAKGSKDHQCETLAMLKTIELAWKFVR